jgi:hypothetical protein
MKDYNGYSVFVVPTGIVPTGINIKYTITHIINCQSHSKLGG